MKNMQFILFLHVSHTKPSKFPKLYFRGTHRSELSDTFKLVLLGTNSSAIMLGLAGELLLFFLARQGCRRQGHWPNANVNVHGAVNS